MQDNKAFEARLRRTLESMDRTKRSIEATKRPWILWSISAVIALSMIGYPIASTMAEILNVENSVLNYPYRLIVVALSIATILVGISVSGFRLPILLSLFMFAYLLRLFFDLSNYGLEFIERDTLFFIFSVAIPTVAMGAANIFYEEKNAAVMFVVFGAVACALITYSIYLGGTITGELDLSQRNYLEALNPITISYTGLFTAAAAYTALNYSEEGERARRYKLLIYIPIIALATFTFLLGGSRGPIVGLAIFIGLQAIVRGNSGIAMVIFSGIIVAIGLYSFSEIAFFQRFGNLAEDPSVLERLTVQSLAIDQALSSPLWGSPYLELTTLSYPHNLVIESAMALGILGGAAMAAICLMLLRDLFTMMRFGHILMPIIGTTALANAFISGSLFASRDFFMAAVLCALLADNMRIASKVQAKRNLTQRVFAGALARSALALPSKADPIRH